MMTTILRVMCFFILFPLVVSCASNRDVKDIKNMMAESREESYQLKNRIDLLYIEIDDDKIRLNSLEESGAGLSYTAMELKNKIDKNQALVDSLSHELKTIKGAVTSNSNEIEILKNEQQNKRRAIQEALLNNSKTKIATSQGISELEEQYEEKRKYNEESGEKEK